MRNLNKSLDPNTVSNLSLTFFIAYCKYFFPGNFIMQSLNIRIAQTTIPYKQYKQ